ncbi:aldehyde dehydrogenase family protein [Paeniglutamicibacter gangotriensis]|uniref:Aldehyde dehydrogenase family protein n=1 Tax=Paeniglutamicibacter gangotriensis TaxID=254787 RepID=A0A5B0EFD2_9MICC|nr:aldehyde dehydrogenase family protein [Paeniglutamicibacter gangotriensis]KAA0977082.1 aldehyde dehydrogenase family protein [Paeniglutamicibacter gangotriensis]
MANATTTQTLELKQLINGQWESATGKQAQSLNPADPQEVVASYATATEENLESAIAAGRAALADWDKVGIIGRGRVLRRAAQLLEERAEGIAVLMTREQGKTLADSRGEVGATVETLYYQAGSARNATGTTFPSGNGDELVRTIRRPVGVVGVITPWNFPLQIPAWKIAPALLWGNTVIWKSASDTPAVSVAFANLLIDAGVPAGVLNLLLGPGSLGDALVSHPGIAAVTFTGSVPVGHQIRERTVLRGAKLQMELGGHNAAIVMPDADVASAAAFIVAAAMSSTGQKCTATRRIIAVGDVHDKLLEALKPLVSALVSGPGIDADSSMGPVISARAQREVEEALDTARSEGATVLAQGSVPADAPGHYVTPTLLGGTDALTITREEVFGPVATLMRVANLDEAIALANATDFGLTASVFTSDEQAIRRCLDEVVAGLIKVNGPSTGSEVHAPFGGLRDSSFPAPREQNGDSCADFYTESKTAYIRTAPAGHAS